MIDRKPTICQLLTSNRYAEQLCRIFLNYIS